LLQVDLGNYGSVFLSQLNSSLPINATVASSTICPNSQANLTALNNEVESIIITEFSPSVVCADEFSLLNHRRLDLVPELGLYSIPHL
jgi:hypothetical protein